MKPSDIAQVCKVLGAPDDIDIQVNSATLRVMSSGIRMELDVSLVPEAKRYVICVEPFTFTTQNSLATQITHQPDTVTSQHYLPT